MDKLIFSLLAVLMLVGCGKAPVQSIEPEVQPYFDQAVQAAKDENFPLNVSDMTVEYGDVGTATAKYTNENGRPFIRINKQMWNILSFTDREGVILHEIGHYIGRVHDENKAAFDGSAAESIMYPVSNEVPFKKYKSYYIHQLFHPAANDLTQLVPFT